MTLETKQGNAFDTASLLIALLRASGIHARYAYGTVRIPIESVMNWVGGVTKPEAAIQLLAQGGIPVVSQVQGGVIKFAKLEHIWVEAWIDFIPSRGAKHKTGDSWIPLDASFKQYEFTEGMDLQGQVPFDAEGFVEHLTQTAQINETEGWVSGIDQNYLQTSLQNYQTQLENYLTQTHPNATVGDVLGTQTIIPANRPVLAAGLPYQLVAKGNTFAMLPASLRHSLTVKLYDSAVAQSMDNPSLVHTLTLSDLASHRLGITYVPATANDTQVLEEFALAGAETLPVYLVKLKPVLELDGIELISGNAVGMGQAQYYTLLLKDPETTYPLSGTLNAGDEIVFGVNGNGIEPQMVSKRLEVVTSNSAAENLHQVALHYWLESDLFNELLAKFTGVHQFRLPSVGLFSSPLTIEWLFGIPRTGSYQGRAMDIKHARLAAVGPDNPTRLHFMKQAGFQGSYLEGSIFEQLFKSQLPAVSAAQFLEAAAIQGISLFTLTQANVATALPLLSIDDSLKDTLRQTVQAGRTVVIPQRELTLGKYMGIGYVIYDPVTGGGAYMIDGGFNGGRQGACVGSTEPQMDVIDPVVIALFGVPGSYPNLPPVWVPPPLKDPLWRKLLLRFLVATRVVVVPIPIAVGITVVLIIIAHLVRRAMMEAQLEGQVGEGERCKENCASKYPTYWKCEILTAQYPDYRYASEFVVKNELEVITGCVGAKKKNEVPATEGPCGQQKPSGARGIHIVYYHRGSNLGSVGSCPCCQDTLKGPSIKKRFSIIRLGGKMCR